MQNADSKARTRRGMARVTSSAGTGAKARRWAVLSLFAVALSGLAPQAPARADDGSLETQKGGLFHRKGWIHPEIYERRDDRSKPTSETSAPARSASTSRSRATVRARPRSQARNQTRTASTAQSRIPRTVVRRREQTIKRSAGRPKPAPATPATRVASLTTTTPSSTSPSKPSVTGGTRRINWLASSRCLTPRLRAAIAHVAVNYGRVRVSSTCRSRSRNRRVGGARRSYHLTGQAADFRVFGNIRAASRYLRSLAGGYKHYGGGRFHIDTGPKRSW